MPVLPASLAVSLTAGTASADLPTGYPGKPYKDSVVEVPGRLRLFRFDEGAKEAVWHDYEATNAWYCKVRAPAAVGLQLMGAGGDKWEPGKAEPGMTLVKDDCYMAQTNTGDWTKYTVHVKAKGTYSLSFLEAANGTTTPFIGVSFLNGKDSVGTGKVTFPFTSYFHNWVYARNLASLALNGASLMPDGRLRLSLENPVEGFAGPLRMQAYDLSGRPLFSEALQEGGPGKVEFLVRPKAPLHGVVLLRLTAGTVSGATRKFSF